MRTIIIVIIIILLHIHVSELYVGADLEVLGFLLAVTDELLLPDLTDSLA